MKNIVWITLLLFIVSKINAQVNLQTGSATFSLPIFSWQDDKSRLNANIGLSYNSGNGLRTSDVASNVGQGWNLLAGGVINRMQVGEPDDQVPYYGIDAYGVLKSAANEDYNDITRYPAGYLYNPAIIVSSNVVSNPGCPNVLANYPIFTDRNHLYKPLNAFVADKELDYFTFQFNGRTGMFILDRSTCVANGDGTYNGSGVCLGDSKLKIKFQSKAQTGIRTSIIAFSIQDENGLTYYFNEYNGNPSTIYGTAKVLKENYCDANLTKALTQPTFQSGHVYHEAGFDNDPSVVNSKIINSWYLTEIDDALTINSDGTPRKVVFYYTANRVMDVDAGVDISYYKENNYIVLSHQTSKTCAPVIDNIVFPDKHKVQFNYGAQRVDMAGDRVLGSVDVTYNDNGNIRYLSKYQLNTTYFLLSHYGTPVSPFEKQVARLCLQSVMQYGVDVKGFNEPYIFDYYLNTVTDASGTMSTSSDAFVPPSFSPIKDIWGFYNGSKSVDYWTKDANGNYTNAVIPDTASPSSLNFNQLKSLCYLPLPSSTSTTPNLNPNSGYAQNGLLKQITYPTGGFIKYFYQQNQGSFYTTSSTATTQIPLGGVHVSQTQVVDAGGGSFNNCEHPMVTNYLYTASDGSTSSLWGMESPINYISTSSHYEPASKHFYWHFLSDMGCNYRIQYPGIVAREQAVSLTSSEESMIAISNVLNVVSTILEVVDVINVILNASFANIVAVALDVLGAVVEVVLTCFGHTPKEDNTSTVYYNADINSANGLPSQYNRVEVSQGSSGGIGKTVFEFTDLNSYGLWMTSNPTLSNAQRYAPWAYGLPLKTTVYDASGNMVKQTLNSYNWDSARKSFTAVHPSYKCMAIHSSSWRYDDWQKDALLNSSGIPDASKFTSTTVINPTDPTTNPLEVQPYNFYTGRVELTKTLERVYNTTSSQYIETETDYSYDVNNYQVNHTVTKQSNGDVFAKDTYYSCDYATTTSTNAAATILKTLASDNILNAPVKTVIYKEVTQAVTTPNVSIVSNLPDNNGVCDNHAAIFTATCDQSNVSILWTVNGNIITGANSLNFTYFVNEGDVIVCKAIPTVPCATEYGISNAITITSNCINLDKKNPKNISVDSSFIQTMKMYAYNSKKMAHGPNTYFTEEIDTQDFSSDQLPRNRHKEFSINNPCTTIVNYYLSETATEYETLANGDIKPSRTLTERTAQPVPASAWKFYDPTTTLDAAFAQVQTFSYDANGNLIGMQDEGSHTVTNIYDYNDKYVTASVINADPTADKPAYTSFETSNGTSNLGGWTATGTTSTSISSANAITGSKSFTLSSANHLSAPVGNASKPYKLSFWATGTPTVSSGATQLKNAPTINGYTYYEYDVAQGTTSVSITASSSLNIDELRLYPKTSRMRTVSYDPLIGKTTECDENNRLTYYQYDELGRLRFTKDDYANIIKMQEYNIVGKQSVCPAGYSNNAISETFIKNDCGVGYIGSSVTYKIDANTYQSNISQLDADNQAQAKLNSAGQANANTNGTCLLLYGNVAMSGTYKTDCAELESVPSVASVTYTVPENTYYSLSQAVANQMAQDDINANGQLYANQNAACAVSTDPDWNAVEPRQVTCQVDANGHNTGYESVYMQDQNPNSTTYLQYAWKTGLPSADLTACPIYVPCDNCTLPCQKCINGHCDMGIPIGDGYKYELIDGVSTPIFRWYHFEFRDGTSSGEIASTAIPSGCIND